MPMMRARMPWKRAAICGNSGMARIIQTAVALMMKRVSVMRRPIVLMAGWLKSTSAGTTG